MSTKKVAIPVVLMFLVLSIVLFDSWNSFTLFIGRFHPLVIHFPIAILSIAFLLEVLSQNKAYNPLKGSLPLLLYIGSISAIISTVLGFMLSSESGYSDESIFWHQWLGISTAGLSILLVLIKNMISRQKYLFIYSTTVICLMITGHLGGNLTYGDDYLVENLPPSVKTFFNMENQNKYERKLIENIPEANIYEEIIHPIFEENCISCHNGKKRKGELNMETFEDMMKGGESGDIIHKGIPEKSELITLITLPDDDPDKMPPDGRTPISPADQELLMWWIKSTNLQGQKVSEVEVNNQIKDILFKLSTASQSEWDKLKKTDLPPPDQHIITELEQKGVIIKKISLEAEYLEVNYSNCKETIELIDFENLLQIKDYVVWLDLGNKGEINDSFLKIVNKFNNLLKLHLENTSITDQGIKEINNLTKLEYLNLYGTKITDQSMETLQQMTHLKSLFTWDTNIQEE